MGESEPSWTVFRQGSRGLFTAYKFQIGKIGSSFKNDKCPGDYLGNCLGIPSSALGRVVANCHKFPATDFERFRLSPEDIEQVYTDLLSRLHSRYPDMRVLFTVSPIRHWKDGAHANQLSKAVLLLAIDKLKQRLDYVSYFPSYEIVMDELRDYRFYTEDMLHISPQGIEYIWEKFQSLYMTSATEAWMKRIDKINKTLLHRPADPDSSAYQELMKKTAQERERIERELGISFS